MGFAPIFGRFCPIFLHLVQELTPNFGESRNKFCNIFVTILPHLFRFGETSFYGGKKRRFSSFSGRGGGLFRYVLGSPTRGAVERSETERLYGRIPRSGNCCFRFRDPEVLPQTKQPPCPTSPSTPFGVATSPSRGGFGRPLRFSFSPEAPLLGELSSQRRD